MRKGAIFSDESGHDATNRYGAICTVSGPIEELRELHFELNKILKAYGKSELKFQKVRGEQYLQIAKEFVTVGLDCIYNRKIWVHVVIWDTHDSRHKVSNRDDSQNMARMYYHTLKNVHKDWKYIDKWNFFPDEFYSIDWKNYIIDYMEKTKFEKEPSLFENFNNKFRFPDYEKVSEKDSKMMTCIQLADIFAGIVRTSYESSFEYQLFTRQNKKQFELFQDSSERKLSKNSTPKFYLMKFFHDEAKKRSLGVNFSKDKCFQVFSKKNNIHIYKHVPQGEYDKAPQKTDF